MTERSESESAELGALADANASAEARLREALENTNQLLIDVMHDQEADIRDRASKQFDKNIDALSKPAPVAANASAVATYKLGRWLSAALGDPNVCAEMKADINAWIDAGQPNVQPTADASAEARLREALDKRCYTLSEPHLSGWRLILGFNTLTEVQDAHEALYAHPHASDCDKQGETTKSEASSHEKRRLDASGEQTSTGPETSISPVRIIAQRHVSAPSANHDVTGGESAATPSDRPADVTVEEVAKIIGDYTGSIEADEAARALLDAFTVGRR